MRGRGDGGREEPGRGRTGAGEGANDTGGAEPSCLDAREAFPCRRAFGSDSKTSVELDPEHEVETRAVMEQRGLVPVGW